MPAVATTESQRARRERILGAATTLLEQREYDRIQMRDVAEAGGVALGTLYRYFPSKEQLFAHVLLEWTGGFETTVRRRTGAADGDAARLVYALRRAVGAFERHPTFFGLITVLEGATDPAVARAFRQHRERFGGVLAGALAGVDPDDARVIVTMTMALVGTLLRQWAAGTLPIGEVYRELDRAVQIVFGEPRSR
jgi:TetR/AcrR family transcriptional regulator, cholesterol catabolism regulator